MTVSPLRAGVRLTVRDRLSAVSALAVLLACSSLWSVFGSPAWLLPTVGVVLVVALASVLARRTRLPRALHPAATALALVVYLVVGFAASTLRLGVLPGAATVRALRDLASAAGTDLSQYAPPAPATTGLVLLVVAGVGAVAVVVDALATVAGRPAAAGIPLLALFAVPSGVLPGGLGWLPFVLGAAGWLALLLVEGREEAARWGTALRSGGGDAGLGRVGRRIGGAALGVAVIVPVLVPGLDTRLFDGGDGGGSGSGGGRSVTTYNPITRLRGALNLPDPVTILRYTTSDPQPDYLRMTTLGVYDGAGWRQEVLRGNLRDDGVDDPLAAPLGRSVNIPTRAVTAQVAVSSLDAFWLPLPATPSRVDVDGPWMWDPGSESVFSTRSNTSQVESYSVESSRVLPDPAQLVGSENPLPPQIEPYLGPIEATDAVRALTARVVRGQTTDYGRATALQAFFRNAANDFTYAEDTDTGGSPDALEDFLQQRRGFCEQYASAMAAMLRLSPACPPGSPSASPPAPGRATAATWSPRTRRTPGPRRGSRAPAGSASSRRRRRAVSARPGTRRTPPRRPLRPTPRGARSARRTTRRPPRPRRPPSGRPGCRPRPTPPRCRPPPTGQARAATARRSGRSRSAGWASRCSPPRHCCTCCAGAGAGAHRLRASPGRSCRTTRPTPAGSGGPRTARGPRAPGWRGWPGSRGRPPPPSPG